MNGKKILPLLASLAVACAPPQERFSARSSSIVFASGALWVASPDDDAVIEVRPDNLLEVRRIAVEGAPEQLASIDGTLVVALSQATSVALVHDDVQWIDVPCGGTHAVVDDGMGGALVACANDDRVLRIDLERAAVDWVLDSPGRPTALAVIDDRFAVTASRTGEVHVYSLADRSLQQTITLEGRRGFAAVQVDALAAVRGRFVAAYQRVDHDSDRERPAERGGYGSVVADAPRIEPLLSACGQRYARFDGGPRVTSGPSAIASAIGSDIVWVAHRYTDDVVALRCGSTSEGRIDRLATFTVGRGPRGLAVSEDGRTAFVDLGFAHAIARLSLDEDDRGPEGPVREAELERARTVGATRLSAAALRGRALFADADDTHLTPSGVVTCATCHPGGGEDGLVWFLHTRGITAKLRRTPPAWAARTELAPFHWDGAFADAADLSRATIRELMEGDGLLIDTTAIAAWMNEAPMPPGWPTHSEGDAAQVARGEAVFRSAGCGECHHGPLFSDAQPHAVVFGGDRLTALEAVDTPSLRGVRARPPYLHDGRAPTLRAVLTDHNDGDRHGRTSTLTNEELDALELYLRTL